MNNDLKKVLPVAKNHIMSLRSKFKDLSQSSLLRRTASAKHIESKYHDYSFQNGKELSQYRQKCLKLQFDLTATRGQQLQLQKDFLFNSSLWKNSFVNTFLVSFSIIHFWFLQKKNVYFVNISHAVSKIQDYLKYSHWLTTCD